MTWRRILGWSMAALLVGAYVVLAGNMMGWETFLMVSLVEGGLIGYVVLMVWCLASGRK
jgi:hypothetical protein